TNSGGNPWGNQLAIDHWAYSEVDIRESLSLGNGCLDIAKSSDAGENARVGDTVNYTVTVTNDGTADFTDAEPASFTDDLSGVLDDAIWNDDVDVTFSAGSTGDAPELQGTDLTWTGPLK